MAELEVESGEEVAEIAVRVAVRVRPFVTKERVEQCRSCVRVHSAERQVVLGKDRAFSFDYVFGEGTSQQQVFDDACATLVERCFQGYNATVFAYGQTGSGKTFTMGSGSIEGVPSEELGVVPRVVAQVFDQLDASPSDTEWSLRVSYLEIYNEQVKDLLHPRTPPSSISIREDASGGIFVQGVCEEEVHTAEELLRCLEIGSASRTTGSTLMNEHSSRSHSLFTIMIQRRDGAGTELASKFHLVDLAGSERNKKTGAAGTRFRESVTINQGLLALGNVIAALDSEGHGRRAAGHIPYRESKLTRLLQDSLGGNSHTLMIACIGPADSNLDESLNTLRCALPMGPCRSGRGSRPPCVAPVAWRHAPPTPAGLRHRAAQVREPGAQHQEHARRQPRVAFGGRAPRGD